MGSRTPVSKAYEAKVQQMEKKLKDPKKGFELNRRLLLGELAPEKWVKQMVPKRVPDFVSLKDQEKKQKESEKPAVVQPSPAVKKAVPAATTAESSAREASKYYFFGTTAKEQAQKYVPKKIQAKKAISEKPKELEGVKGVSAWNVKGTWEERNLTAWAIKRLGELLKNIPVAPFPDGAARFLDADWTVKGEASCVFSRGKQRYGWELKVQGKYSGEYKGSDVKGDVSVPCFDETDGLDSPIVVKAKKPAEADAVVKRAITQTTPLIKERLAQFIAEFKQQ